MIENLGVLPSEKRNLALTNNHPNKRTLNKEQRKRFILSVKMEGLIVLFGKGLKNTPFI